MKRIIKLAASTIGVFLFSAGVAYALSPGDTFLVQRDPSNTFNQTTLMPLPPSPAILTMDTSTNLPVYTTFSTGLVFSSGAKTLSVSGVPQANVTNLTSDLAGKFANPVGTTAQYVRGDGTLATLPAIPSPSYLSYQSIVSQSGGSAPTEINFVNDFAGVTLTWARTGAGTYTLTANSAVFTSGKTAVIMSNPSAFLNNFKYAVTSSTIITVQTASLSVISLILTTGNADSLLSSTLIEVRVYP